MKSKKSTNKNGAITKKITLNSERKDMTITDTLALCSINRCSSNDPVLCEAPLTIDPEFDELVNTMNIDRTTDEPMGRLKIDTAKVEERKSLRLELLKKELQHTQVVAPFIVWKQGKNRIIVDGRHNEHKAALQLGLPIHTIEFEFKSMDEARVFVAMHCLNKPHLNAPQRMLLVRKLEEDIRKIAKQHQGKRSDLALNKKRQKFHTTKIMSVLANVGEHTLRKFYAILNDGEEYLPEGKTQEFTERILAGTLSVHSVHNRLIEAKKKRAQKGKFSKDNPEVFTASKSNEDEERADEIVYKNPSTEDGFHNRIICGDRVEVMKQLPDDFCNLICLSPEFNVERVIYDVHIPVVPHYTYLQKLNALWVECARVLRDGGRLVINLPALVSVFEQNDHRAFNTPLFMDVMQEIEKLDVGLNLREALVWHKRSPIRKHHLSFPSPKNPCYRADHEYILIFSKKNWEMTPENEGAPHDLTADIYKDDCSSVISVAPQSKGVGDHPAVYPESLVEKIIRMHSFVGDTVVDCSNGSGTTTAVAARLGRRWFGCDISPKYCKAAESRTQKAYKQFLKSIKDVDEAKDDKNKAA